jgi:hypothetical protein
MTEQDVLHKVLEASPAALVDACFTTLRALQPDMDPP